MPKWGKAVTSMLVVIVLTAIICTSLVFLKATSKTIIVPDDYPTIQDAISNANAGDTLLVKQGIYNLTSYKITIDKPLTLVGQNSQETIIVGNYSWWGINSMIDVKASETTVTGFTIIGNAGLSGINIYTNASNVKIINNNIENTITGIYDNGYNDVISSNNITNSLIHGIYELASNSVIEGNNITFCKSWGIIIDSNQNVTIQGNSIAHNGANYNDPASPYTTGGVFLRWTGPFYIHGNNITDNLVGILFGENCSYSKVYSNNLLGNQIGVNLLNLDSPFGNGNTVYRNNFVNNVTNVFVEHAYAYPLGKYTNNGTDTVSWDNGTVGNYWSDYLFKYPNASEIDNSTIGNTPYTINENNTDNHPLIQQANTSSSAPKLTPYISIGILIPPITIPIFIAALIIEAIAFLLLYRRHRKTAESNKSAN